MCSVAVIFLYRLRDEQEGEANASRFRGQKADEEEDIFAAGTGAEGISYAVLSSTKYNVTTTITFRRLYIDAGLINTG